MSRRRSRFTPACSPIGEALESRLVMSASSLASGTVMQAEAQSIRQAATQTTLAVSAGTLGQPVTFTVSVRGPASAGAPTGTVKLIDHGSVIATLTPSPYSSGKFSTSEATYTLTPQPGGPSYFFGKHSVTAQFIPSGGYAKSVASKTFVVGQPSYTAFSDGVKVATITPGSGPAIQAGQTANVLYTGYLTKTGQIFDDSAQHGGTSFSFSLGAGQVVPGFDQGTTGMQAGETRIIEIPAAEGYGSTANGPIPANSTLIFVMTLQSIS